MSAGFLLLAFLGVLLLVGVNRLMGGWAPLTMDNPSAVADRFATDFPDFVIGTVALGVDGKAALVDEHAGPRIGLLRMTGDRHVSRLLTPGALRAVSRNADRLRLLLDDFTLPDVTIALPAGTAEHWEQRLERLIAELRHA